MTWLIYLFPALMDAVVAQVIFVNGVRLAKMGCSDWLITGVWAGWNLPYVCVCLASGKFLTPRNAGHILMAACALAAMASAGFAFTRSIGDIYVLTAAGAVSAGLFFPSFQTFMKTVDSQSRKSVAWSTGLYTFAWSTGLAFGPLIAGFVMESGPRGWQYSYGVSAGMALLAGVGVWLLRHLGKPTTVTLEAKPPPTEGGAPAGAPDLAWLGWLSALVALSMVAMLRSLLPAMAEKEMGMAESRQGVILFLFSIAQAMIGLKLCWSRDWMYQPRAVFLFGLIGVAGTLGFAFSRSLALLSVAAVACGVYAGSFFFYLVYHSLVHPTRSIKYVAINEAIVGGTGIIAPLAAGTVSEAAGSYTYPYALIAILLATTVLFQVAVHRRKPLPG
jgi:MFS family permease